MPNIYTVVVPYTETVYGKAYKFIEADSQEEAIELAQADVDGWHFKEGGSTEFEMETEEAEATRG